MRRRCTTYEPCTDDNPCSRHARMIDAREFGDDGWSADDRGLLADGAAANEVYGRGGY